VCVRAVHRPKGVLNYFKLEGGRRKNHVAVWS
jgi:hypothetical protein